MLDFLGELSFWQWGVNVGPVITYYVAALMFHIMHNISFFDKYRIQDCSGEDSDLRNKVEWAEALPWVVLQHTLQLLLGLGLASMDPTKVEGKYDEGLTLVAKWILAMIVLDTYQYWIHRWMHTNRWLYNQFHSWHHRLHCPYPVGALYNHPVEGLVLDLGSATVALLISKLDLRAACFFASISTFKTVCDHSNFHFWFFPFHSWFSNNAVYHNFHHEPKGFRFNYSQPYFMMWDQWMGTAHLPKIKTKKPKTK